jgi:hypothetical protein
MTSTAIRKIITAVSMSEIIAGYSSADLAAMEKIIADSFRHGKTRSGFLEKVLWMDFCFI